ncbi:hypothetical protein NXG27_00905 [Megasphaera paucivorans]|uniref:Uncharacterized protein n=1 Tax=Megasphaera paucivorans TaxID=349095 RepID=A0A1G9QC81_9FIRM|nr:hypothetical protein [Megasphaera paucivorans]SDM08520.1 hypothetical protein SAMN05660299_00183 [Megasphaera paucivorans]
MISVKELMKLIRYKTKDNNAVQFSDYDIIQALNECIRYVNQYYALANSDFLEKAVHIREDTINAQIDADNVANNTSVPHIDMRMTGINLPDDFIDIVAIERTWNRVQLEPCQSIRDPLPHQYKIVGGKLYAGVKDLDMVYNAAIAGVKTETDNVNIPDIFKDALCKISCTILANNPNGDTMAQAVEDVLSNIVPRRKYTNAHRQMPFYC